MSPKYCSSCSSEPMFFMPFSGRGVSEMKPTGSSGGSEPPPSACATASICSPLPPNTARGRDSVDLLAVADDHRAAAVAGGAEGPAADAVEQPAEARDVGQREEEAA